MDFFTLTRSLVIGQVKSMAKEKMLQLAAESIAKDLSKKVVSGHYVFFKNKHDINDTINTHKQTIRAADRLSKMGNSFDNGSISEILKHGNKFNKNLNKLSEREYKIFINSLKDSYKLSKTDKHIFFSSQFKPDKLKGTFTIDELLKDKDIVKSCTYALNNKKINSYDVYISGLAVDGKFNLKQTKEDFSNIYKSALKAEENYLRFERRLSYLEENKYLLKTDGGYNTTELFEKECFKVKNSFNDYDSRIVDILKNDTNSINDIKSALNEKRQEKAFTDLMKRIDLHIENKNIELVKNTQGETLYKLTEKYHQERAKFLEDKLDSAAQYLNDKFEIYKAIGYINEDFGRLHVTDRYYKAYCSADIKEFESDFLMDKLVCTLKNETDYQKAKVIFTKDHLDQEFMANIFDDKLQQLIQKNIVTIDPEKNVLILQDKNINVEAKEFEFNWYDIKVLRKFNEEKNLTLDNYNNLDYIEKGRIDKQLYHGILSYENGTYSLTSMGEKLKHDYLSERRREFSIENFKLDNLSKILYEKGTFTIDELAKNTDFQKMLEYRKNKGEFKFSRYDANVILRDFKKGSNSLDIAEFKSILEKKFKDPEKVNKELSIRTRRLDKLHENGYLTIEDGVYIKTAKAIEEEKQFKGFQFSTYDVNVLYEHIKAADNQLTGEKLKQILEKDFNNPEDLAKQLDYDIKRLESNFEHGYINKDNGAYSLNKTSHEKIDEYYKDNFKHVYEALEAKTEYLKYLGFIDEKDGIYKITEEFRKIVEYKDFQISPLDKNIYNRMKENKGTLNLAEELEKIKEKYKGKDKEIKRQSDMLKGRLEKLDHYGLVYEKDGSYKYTSKLIELLDDEKRFKGINDKVITNKLSEDSINATKINAFTYQHIVDPIKEFGDSMWSKERYIGYYADKLPMEELEKKIKSVEGHLKSLEKIGYVKKVDNGYALHDELLERAKLRELSSKDMYTEKQIAFMTEIRDFLNITHDQAVKQIFNNEFVGKYSLNELIKKNIIDFKVKELDGSFQKVYYLNPAGKKEITRITGEEKRIYDSKIHNRPQELKHDLYVYSAYKDYEQIMTDKGYRITKVMTDKDMRAVFNKGQDSNSLGESYKADQKVEFADLYIEYEDISTLERGYVNIEVDVGYTSDVIANKAEKIDNLVWYTNTPQQADKILNVAAKASVKVIEL
jgi:hypothetical protein